MSNSVSVFFRDTFLQFWEDRPMESWVDLGPKKIKAIKAMKPKASRHVAWVHCPRQYVCIRASTTVFSSLDDIDARFETGSIQEADFSVFQHTDVHVRRGMKETPKYEAVYHVKDSGYYRVQIKHLDAIYKGIYGSKQPSLFYAMKENGVEPVFVDRYIAKDVK